MVVVGAGVVGLSCAVRLAETGYDVGVLARDLPPETTSAVAAAIWYPYLAEPREQVLAWAADTFRELAALAGDDATGVRLRDGLELLPPDAPRLPWWRDAVPEVTSVDRPAAGVVHGWRLRLPVVDMAVYLSYLCDRLDAAGGTLTRHWLDRLPGRGIVVNATGLASRAMAGDLSLHPVRGQVVRLAQTGVEEWRLDGSDEEHPVYVVPREHDVVVGGTAQDGSWDLRPDSATAAAILERATRLVPTLRGAPVLGHRVGLRPARPGVRLETVPHDDGADGGIVHCYGHGGAGVTLSWGCADEVLAQVTALCSR